MPIGFRNAKYILDSRPESAKYSKDAGSEIH